MKIKICGLVTPADVDAVNQALPDYAGFVFAAGRRQVTEEQAALLRARLLPGITPVGVFVNAPENEVIRLAKSGLVRAVQLHGDEDEAYAERVRQRAGCPVIRAVRVGDTLPPLPLNADYLLFDALFPGAYGGTGKRFDWRLIAGVERPYFLAGGICPANAAEAGQTGAYALDVSSGAEENGRKSARLIGEIVNTVRSVTHE